MARKIVRVNASNKEEAIEALEMALAVVKSHTEQGCVCTHVSMEYPPDGDEPYLYSSPDCDENLLVDAKKLYLHSHVTLKDFLNNTDYLNIMEKRDLLCWAAKDDIMEVLNNGEVIERE